MRNRYKSHNNWSNGCIPVLLLLLSFSFGCQKDTNEEPAPDPKTMLITAAPWKYDNAGVDGDRNGSIDVPLLTPLPACITDNFLTLLAGGTGSVDEGPAKCDPSIPQSTPATWSFASSQTLLNLGGSGLFGVSGQFKIVELSTTRLYLSKDTTLPGRPVPIALIIQLKH